MPVPPNVRRAVNYYVSTSGVPLAGARNVDMKDVAGVDHMSIQSMESMHRRVIGEIAGR